MKIPGVTFSWKRAIGVSKVKQQIARKTGIPTTKNGIERKVGRTVMNLLFKKKLGCFILCQLMQITTMTFFKGILSALSVVCFASQANADSLLTGMPIGTVKGWNYESNSVEQNIAYKLFDGDLNTYFATKERSYTWAGLDLGTKHVITRVGWSPRNATGYGEKRVLLGVFEGANSEDFLDAIPFYMITEAGQIGTISYGDVNCSRGFRYVRYVGPSDSRCNLAELEFYGVEGEGDDSHLFQLTNLPMVSINTINSEEPYDKVHDITSNIIIINDHQIDVDHSGAIRERGNGSRTFPKKPWRIKFDKKQYVLDAPAKAKKWTLINNYGDKTLMRNILAFEIAKRIGMDWVPYCQPEMSF